MLAPSVAHESDTWKGRCVNVQAADCLNESFFDDAVLNVESKLTCSLLWCTPTDSMGQTGNVLDLFCIDPLSFLWNWSAAVLSTALDCTHVFNFCGILHVYIS